jgi:hypothetical protein
MTKTKNGKKTEKKALLIKHLLSGKSVTRKLAETKFGIPNLRATISNIRKIEGKNKIKTNFYTVKGVKLVKYTWN